MLLSSRSALASCSADGLTVVYINGISTPTQDLANLDKSKLADYFARITKRADVKFVTGYNPSHLAGLGDLVQSASQILNSPISDYDLKNILLQIYPEINTRKILLVGHSQGTFYANEVYKYLIENGETTDSVGVYNVATPASSVAGYGNVPGKGAYLTSENDRVINFVRNAVSAASIIGAKQPLPANITIPLTPKEDADRFGGHSFSDVYLANASGRIVPEIQEKLEKLTVIGGASATGPGCFTPPPMDASYYRQQLVFSVADAVATRVAAAGSGVAVVGDAATAQIINAVSAVSDFGRSVVSTAREALANMFGGGAGEKVVEVVDTSAGRAVSATPSGNISSQDSKGETSVVPTNQKTGIGEAKIQSNIPEISKALVKPAAAEAKTEKVAQPQPQALATAVRSCDFSTSRSPSHYGAIMNEVAWAGGPSSAGLAASDEWIELKNVSGSGLDMSGWRLVGEDEDVNIVFKTGSVLPAGGYYLLERTDDNSVPEVKADVIYSGGLSNSDDGLRLFNPDCGLVDEVMAAPNWPAGDASSRRTMERNADLTWRTYVGSGTNGILGTPRQTNSSAATVDYTGAGYSGGGGSQQNINSQNDKAACAQSGLNPASRSVLINEVAWAGTAVSSSDEWVEFYNPGSAQASLSNWEFLDKTAEIKVIFGPNDTIAAGGYYLLERTDNNAVPNILADKIFSGAIGNTDESLRLFDVNCGLVDEVVAAPNWPAGTSSSDYKTAERGADLSWHTYSGSGSNGIMGTPRATNSAPTAADDQQANQTQEHRLKITAVIFDPPGPDAGKELIEISNIGNATEDLGAYSIQYLAGGDIFDNIDKKNFSAGSAVAAGAVFKIGANCHTSTPCEGVDLSWSQALGNDAGTVFLVDGQDKITSVTDSRIVDTFVYQATQATLPAPTSFSAVYDPDNLSISLSWIADVGMEYELRSDSVAGEILYSGTDSKFIKRIYEVGRPYRFYLQAKDVDGNVSNAAPQEVTAPSFIKNVSLYNAEHYYFGGPQTDDILEFSYDNYPFLPQSLVLDPSGSGPNYKAVVFYFNEDAPARTYLDNGDPLVNDRENVLRLAYRDCAESNSIPGSTRLSLVLPDSASQCDVRLGGFANGALDYPTHLATGNKNMLFPVAAPTGAPLVAGDYVTAAFYGFRRDFPQGTNPANLEGGVWSNFTLLAVDKTPHRFSSSPPAHQKPGPPKNLLLSLNSGNSILTASWLGSDDVDTIPGLLRYEVSYDGGTVWKAAGLSDQYPVEVGRTYGVQVHALDDFNNISDPAGDSITVPDTPPPFGLSNIGWGRAGDGQIKLHVEYSTYPFIPAQSDGSQFDAMLLFFNSMQPTVNSRWYEQTVNSLLVLSHPSCYNSEVKSWPVLILARSAEAVRDSSTGGTNVTNPGECYSWSDDKLMAALVPVPAPGQGGIIEVPVSAIANIMPTRTLDSLTSADFMTIGFYHLDNSNNLVFLANDPHKYYFRL